MHARLWIVVPVTLATAVFLLFTIVPARAAADGKSDFESLCTACHGFGIAGAPRLGDIDAWKKRIEKGMDALYESAINGYAGETGVMPPRGGFASLSDAQLMLIVDYMVKNSR